ncbi:MAG: proline--tRNA ligase [Actinobacteria bacterium]|nr:proline--tRNA ligase [Actinomycetota bacterium]
MRQSKFYVPTLKENPAEAEVQSHRLLIRAGYIRKVAAGVYTFLPLGKRSLQKIENIVREEMNRFGAQEILMPALQPKELWEKTGRWDAYGPMMMKLKDRKGRDFALGPTHEELITTLVSLDVRSYKELPLNLYQIQPKFRDEPRPRFGLIRAREFIMKDAYSFDVDEDGLKESYEKMRKAYNNVFRRVGLKFIAVKAHTGLIGGSDSEEFMALAEIGEDSIFVCSNCGYAANRELAKSKFTYKWPEEDRALTKMHTPARMSVNDVAQFLSVPETMLIKTMIYRTEKGYVAAVIPGDREAVETKIQTALGVNNVELINPDDFEKLGLPFGYVGPVGLKEILPGVVIVIDERIVDFKNGVTGANEKDYHLTGVTYGRDFVADIVADIAEAKDEDACPNCGEAIKEEKAIEVGHIFQLGTKYSESLDACFLNEKGERKPFFMGCYGIGVSRILSAAVEQNNDDRGMFLPLPIAPFELHLLLLNPADKLLKNTAENLYELLSNNGFEVLYDDREDVTPGVKFSDADLIGIPLQIIVGKKFLEESKVEIKIRSTGERVLVSTENLIEYLNDWKNNEYSKFSAVYEG